MSSRFDKPIESGRLTIDTLLYHADPQKGSVILPSYKNAERNTWYCAFYFTDWQGKRKKKKKEGFKTKREAQEWERKFLEQFAGTPDIGFDVLVEKYLKDAKTKLKYTSYRTKVAVIKNRILPYFKDTPINKINNRFINDWKNILINDDIKSNYVRIVYMHLSAIFSYAVEYYNLPNNPCNGIGKLPSDKKEVNYWTLDDFRIFATSLHKPIHIMIFYLLFWTGIRIGEALALTWEDVDLTNKTIRINKTLTRLARKNIVTPPKTDNSNRLIFLPQFIADMMADYKRLSKYVDGRVFPITRDGVFVKLHNSAIKLGLKPIRIHDLRHSHASMLINAGFSPIEVSDRLGHANPAITLKTYSHFYTHKRSELAEKINKLM